MTSFTKISDTEKATISIHPTRKISKINPNIYAGFTEYDLRNTLLLERFMEDINNWQRN